MTPNPDGLSSKLLELVSTWGSPGTAKFTWLNTLNASQRNCTSWCSDQGIVKFFDTAMSRFVKLGPCTGFRVPVSPPNGKWNAPNAAVSFAKNWIEPVVGSV